MQFLSDPLKYYSISLPKTFVKINKTLIFFHSQKCFSSLLPITALFFPNNPTQMMVIGKQKYKIQKLILNIFILC